MPKFEYATTTVACHVLGGKDGVEPPKPPEGDGWQYIGACANESTRFHDWRREIVVANAAKKQ